MLIAANIAGSGGLMSNWKVRAEIYIKADNKDEAWSMATLDLPKNSQIIEIERERVINDNLVRNRISEAEAIAWDNCHKIYILMDTEQVDLMRGYGYDPIITNEEMNPDDMFDLVQEWYENSCSLRFIQAVSTNDIDPNLGFESLVSQFEDQDEEISV